jgi:hypothetical protein
VFSVLPTRQFVSWVHRWSSRRCFSAVHLHRTHTCPGGRCQGVQVSRPTSGRIAVKCGLDTPLEVQSGLLDHHKSETVRWLILCTVYSVQCSVCSIRLVRCNLQASMLPSGAGGGVVPPNSEEQPAWAAGRDECLRGETPNKSHSVLILRGTNAPRRGPPVVPPFHIQKWGDE